jgi:hypothetical protein
MGADGYLIKSEITPDKIIAEVENFLTSNKNGKDINTAEQTQSII